MTQKHVGHSDQDIAYHVEWGFRRECLLWRGNIPIAPNLHPIATEFRSWLLRQGHFSVLAEEHKKEDLAYSNPYTYHTSTIASVLAEAINESHDFAVGTMPCDPVQAEIKRIRIYNEQVLYIARLCEASIKQLLYCTQIGKKYYETAALGALLSAECRGCKGSGLKRHKLSLLGSLAHRYHLCLPFEHCLFEHLKIVARRRNLEATHSDAQLLKFRSAEESCRQLQQDCLDIGNELVHMLLHISELETLMLQEISSFGVVKVSTPIESAASAG